MTGPRLARAGFSGPAAGWYLPRPRPVVDLCAAPPAEQRLSAKIEELIDDHGYGGIARLSVVIPPN